MKSMKEDRPERSGIRGNLVSKLTLTENRSALTCQDLHNYAQIERRRLTWPMCRDKVKCEQLRTTRFGFEGTEGHIVPV
jgi:hypothetical protein